MNDSKKNLEKLKNPPKALSEKDKGLQQVPFRIHRNDYAVVKRLLKDDNWKFQHLIEALVHYYIKRDPLLIKLLVDWKEENVLPERAKDSYTLSKRERRGIFDELEEDRDDL